MTCWVTRPKPSLFAALAAVAIGGGLWAPSASAIPIVDVGGNAGVAAHLAGGVALDATAELNLRGLVIAGQYWQGLSGQNANYLQLGARYNLSPVPMISIAPGLAVVSAVGSPGALVNVTAGFSPFLLPASLEAMVGAGYVSGSGNGLLLPYYVGAKLSLIPFTAFNLRYRGWQGAGPMNQFNGPEVGLEVGI